MAHVEYGDRVSFFIDLVQHAINASPSAPDPRERAS